MTSSRSARTGCSAASTRSERSWSTTASRRRCLSPASASPASSTRTTARWSSASPTWPPPGTRSTITRSTRRRTPSGSPSRPDCRPWPTGNSAGSTRTGVEHVALGGSRTDGVLPGHRLGRRVGPGRLPRRRDPLLGRAGSRPLRRTTTPHRQSLRHLAGGGHRRTRGCPAPSTCRRAEASCRSGSPATPSPAGTTSSSRPTSSTPTRGRRCPTSRETPATTPGSPAPSGSSCTRS